MMAGMSVGLPVEELACEEDANSCSDPTNERGLFQKTRKIQNHMQLVTEEKPMPLSKKDWANSLGPKLDYRQMNQGELGDCYFLAALVSIAYKHPEILENMFVNAALLQGKHPVFSTQWLINGKKSIVATNDQVPVDPRRKAPWFGKGKNGAFWPPMLEKAWAKIFGKYKTIEGGHEMEVFKAITQAPLEEVSHKKVAKKGLKEVYWKKLMEWTKNEYPMGAGSVPNNNGVTKGHAYSILEAIEGDAKYPRKLKMFNPWGSDRYRGDIPNQDNTDGMFEITFEEFLESFSDARAALVRRGAVISSTTLSLQTQSKIVLQFDMENDQPFDVQFEWPNARFISRSCEVADPNFVVAVAKEDSLTDYKLMVKPSLGASNARASFKGGAGKYLVFVNADFPYTKSWLKEFVINVYGPPTQLVLSKQFQSPIDLLFKMQNLCETVTVPGQGEYKLDEKTKMWGMPIFRATVEDGRKGKVVAFMPRMQKTKRDGDTTNYRYGGPNDWVLSTGDSESQVYALAKVSCSQSLLQLDENEPMEPELLPQSIMEIAASGTDDLDVEGICGKYVDRFPRLGKASTIASSGKDEEFPESMASIAKEGTNCGDAARNIFESCAKYNNWVSIAALRKPGPVLPPTTRAPEPPTTQAPEAPTVPPTSPPTVPSTRAPEPPPVTTPPAQGTRIVELGSSKTDKKCVNIGDMFCTVLDPPCEGKTTDEYGIEDYCYKYFLEGDNLESACVSLSGGWKKNVKLSCEKY